MNLLERIDYEFKKLLRHRVQYSCPEKILLGSDYGGWTICPKEINSESVVYSFGIGEDISFDLALIKKFNLTVFGFDPTPRSISWLKKQKLPDRFRHYELGISDQNGSLELFEPTNPQFVSYSVGQVSDTSVNVQVNTLQAIMNRLKHDHIDILKLDIEGSEYPVIEDILKNELPVKQLLVEFHDKIVVAEYGKFASDNIVKLMMQNDYRIFNISERGTEYSFIKI